MNRHENRFVKYILSFNEGARLPSAARLTVIQRISTGNVRKSLASLREQGHVTSKPRIGWFRTLPKNQPSVDPEQEP